MEIAVPLKSRQINAAGRLHARLKQWQASDAAIQRLASRCPGFDAEESLLKVVAVNGLYGTNIYAQVLMAKHVCRTLQKANLEHAGPALVEKIASLTMPNGKVIRHVSFASKFAHFFLNADRFPIMDKYAVRMVKYHLGRRNYMTNQRGDYIAFTTNVQRLMQLSQLECSSRELDKYLWLAGLYRRWQKNGDSKINREARSLFENKSEKVVGYLRALERNDG